jgi:hypothetical protein
VRASLPRKGLSVQVTIRGEELMSEEKKGASTAGLAVYYAYQENGELIMEPYCSCGNPLDEMFRCDRCQQHCHPTEILCEDTLTLRTVEKYIRTSPKLRNFRAMLGKRKKADT